MTESEMSGTFMKSELLYLTRMGALAAQLYAMKAENESREYRGETQAYTEASFFEIADAFAALGNEIKEGSDE